jgi:hypothetical protein
MLTEKLRFLPGCPGAGQARKLTWIVGIPFFRHEKG